MMRLIFSILAAAAGIFSLLIFIRIILSWFGGYVSGKVVRIFSTITDPYLEWWRRGVNLRIGSLDFSAVLAIASVSVIQNIFYALSRTEVFSFRIILVIILSAAWSVVSFILVFLIVVIVLRLIAFLLNCDIYSPFWSLVDSVSQPVLYRFNRIFFGNKIGSYLKGIILSLIVLFALLIGGALLVPLLTAFVYRLPV